MARPLVSDELWELIEPLIPKVARRHRFPGRKRIDDRRVLSGILFVLRTGIPWAAAVSVNVPGITRSNAAPGAPEKPQAARLNRSPPNPVRLTRDRHAEACEKAR